MRRQAVIAALAGTLVAVPGSSAVASSAIGPAKEPDCAIVSYSLTCSPTGGSLPHPARACASISDHPSMLQPAPQGLLEPCPFGADVTFVVTGQAAGANVDTTFQNCASGQSAEAALWESVVPSDAARLATRPDRGFGLFSLGEPASDLKVALGPGRPAPAPAAARRNCRTCTRMYTSGLQVSLIGNHTFTVSLTVTYRHGRVARLTDNNPQATVAGADIDASYATLRRRLARWRAITCSGGVRLLAHGAGPSTQLTFLPYYTTVSVQAAAPACP